MNDPRQDIEDAVSGTMYSVGRTLQVVWSLYKAGAVGEAQVEWAINDLVESTKDQISPDVKASFDELFDGKDFQFHEENK